MRHIQFRCIYNHNNKLQNNELVNVLLKVYFVNFFLFLERTSMKQVVNPQVSDIVVAYSLKYQGFYRAKVLGLCKDVNPPKLRCVLFDFAYVDNILLTNLFVLSEHLSTRKVSWQVQTNINL